MNPAVQLILGCLLLSTVVAYSWWLRLRVHLFRLDLLAIVEDLDGEVRDKSLPHLPIHDAFTRLVKAIFDNPELISVSAFEGLELTVRDADAPAFFLDLSGGLDHRFLDAREWPEEVEKASGRLVGRLLTYLFSETLSGWVFVLRALAFGVSDSTRRAILGLTRGLPSPHASHWLDGFLSSQGHRV